MKIVIIGGVAGGATAAVRARRLSENAEIILIERGRDVAFANCGLPYYIGGEIKERQALLLQTKESLSIRFNLDIRLETEAIKIVRNEKVILLKNLADQSEYYQSYDSLILATGAMPLLPDLPGCELPQVHTIRNLVDIDRLQTAITNETKKAVIIGAGFIGLEMAENLNRRGLAVTIVEGTSQALPSLDQELAQMLHQELAQKNVRLLLNSTVAELQKKGSSIIAIFKEGNEIQADIVIMAIGVRPDTKLAQDAGLAVTSNGAIVVDEFLRTSDPTIYAVGDAIASTDTVIGDRISIPLAGPANRQAHIAASNIFDKSEKYPGIQGTAIMRLFDLSVATTGWNEKGLRRRNIPFEKVYIYRMNHVSYFPGADPLLLKLLFAPFTGKILGCQVIGKGGVDKRIDVIATAMQAGLSARDLRRLELGYAPQYGAAKDPINIAGYVADNLLSKQELFIYAEELSEEQLKNSFILDVRVKEDFQQGSIPGAINIPFEELRSRLNEIPKDRSILCYCQVGQRSYYANLILRAAGYQTQNLAGGYFTYKLYNPRNPVAKKSQPDKPIELAARSPRLCSQADITRESFTNPTVDLRGEESNAALLVKLSEKLVKYNSKTTIKILSNQINFEASLQEWCRLNGYQIVTTQYNNSQFEAFITSQPRINPDSPTLFSNE